MANNPYGWHPGEIYRRGDLHRQLGGQRQSGIVTPSKYPVVLLFTGPSGSSYGYEDGWVGERFLYTGEGQVGDMRFTKGNKAIRDHFALGRRLFLFRKESRDGWVRLVGEFECEGYLSRVAPDVRGNPRLAIVFRLRPLHDIAAIEREAASLTEEELFAVQQARPVQPTSPQRPAGNPRPKQYPTQTVTFERDSRVAAFALARAGGKCELCGEDAPFLDASGEPYLEVHHIIPLAEGGPDVVENVAALCPNCHREAHLGIRALSLRQLLLPKVRPH